MKRFRQVVVFGLVVLEGSLTALPFLLSWLACAFYRSIIAGWEVSGMQTAAKREALRKLMGEDNDAG